MSYKYTTPEDLFIEILTKRFDSRDLSNVLSKLSKDDVDEIIEAAANWSTELPKSSDEKAVVDGAKRFIELYSYKRFSSIVQKLNK